MAESEAETPGTPGDFESKYFEYQGVRLPPFCRGRMEEIANCPVRDSDVWIVTYPKSGTAGGRRPAWAARGEWGVWAEELAGVGRVCACTRAHTSLPSTCTHAHTRNCALMHRTVCPPHTHTHSTVPCTQRSAMHTEQYTMYTHTYTKGCALYTQAGMVL